MKFKKIGLMDIVPAEYNPRKISDSDFEKLSNSISEFGLVDPIIINLKNNRIIGGHQRYKVLVEEYSKNQQEDLICIPLGDIGWVFPNDELIIKDEFHEKALNIALNKITGTWDNEKLQEMIVDFELDDFDLDLTGFEEYELEKLKYDSDVEFEDISEDLNEEPYDVEEESEISIDKREFITCPFCEQHFKEEDVL